jgi:hypothetical protein
MSEKNIVVSMSQQNIDRLSASESTFQKLKDERADAYETIQQQKLDQYGVVISHLKPIWRDKKTESNNLPRDVGINVRSDLINDVGMSKANAKVLYEKAVQFIAKFDDEIPTQATADAVLSVFANKNIKSQNDLKKAVSDEKDQDLAEQIARKLFGKTKKQKIKKDDGSITEEEVYIPTDIDAEKVQAIWEVLEDKRRERQKHDEANSKSLSEVKGENDIINRLDEALAS